MSSAVIERCLRSVRPLVDYVLVEDTGSTDGTQDIIRAYLAREGLPGEVIEEPWRDFAYNRTLGLEHLRKNQEIDYALVMDADDLAVVPDDFDAAAFRAALDKDYYCFDLRMGSIRYWRPQLLSNHKPFVYKGVLHEYVETPPGEISSANLSGFHVDCSIGGARSHNPNRYRDDALVLKRALGSETDPFLRSRYTFYYAQSCRDSGQKEDAIRYYLARAELGYWDEEIYISLLSAARLMEELGRSVEETLATYERASAKCPWRAEALHAASTLCFRNGRNAEGYEIAKRGLGLSPPEGGLFVETWVYEYGLLDEFAINAFWAQHYSESMDASLRLLSEGKLPESQRGRVLTNMRFAFDKLPRESDLGSLGKEDMVTQHALTEARPLHSRVRGAPRVLLAILAKQKETSLPLYLECIEALDYPKSSIVLYVRTNNNTDGTERILRAWVDRVGHLYAGVEFDASDVAAPVQQFGVHEWNATRFRVLGHIRGVSLRKTREHGCDYYFVVDVDNFIRPCTLRELIAADLPIVAPLIRSVEPGAYYSNYHAEIDDRGYYRGCDQYLWILNRWVRGFVEVPVVHCTYLLRADVVPELTYQDGTDRHEYVVFSDSARKARIPQYFDNRQVYGYLSLEETPEHLEAARALLAPELASSQHMAPARAA